MTEPSIFEQSSEERLLRETVREFFRNDLPPERVQELDKAGQPVPDDLWRRIADLGWLALPVSSEYDGLGGDLTTLAVLAEELAYGWASLCMDYVNICMAARLFENFGNEEQRQKILPGLASGEIRIGFSLTEPSGGTDLLSGTTRAELDGDEWVITGQKLYTSRAAEADYFVVLCRTDPSPAEKRARGWSLLLMEPRQDAVTIQKLPLFGFRSGGTSEVFYDGARAPSGSVIGERGRGFYHLIGSLNNERIVAAALGVGIAQAAFDEALAYAKTRLAFGKPIGGFQVIQHYLADCAIELEMVRLLVQKAAMMQSAGQDCSREAAMANIAAGEVAVRVTDKGMRILGGYGMTEHSPMERYLRDARLQVVSPVSNEMGRNLVGEQLGLPRSY